MQGIPQGAIPNLQLLLVIIKSPPVTAKLSAISKLSPKYNSTEMRNSVLTQIKSYQLEWVLSWQTSSVTVLSLSPQYHCTHISHISLSKYNCHISIHSANMLMGVKTQYSCTHVPKHNQLKYTSHIIARYVPETKMPAILGIYVILPALVKITLVDAYLHTYCMFPYYNDIPPIYMWTCYIHVQWWCTLVIIMIYMMLIGHHSDDYHWMFIYICTLWWMYVHIDILYGKPTCNIFLLLTK